MVFSWQTFVIGAILGIIQFGIGLWIGKIVYDRRKQRRSISATDTSVTGTETSGTQEVQESAQKLQTVTSRLQSTVNRVSNDVGSHQVRIEQMTRELNAFKKRSVSITEEVIWERLNQLLRMTTDFSNRLSDAESQIQTQSNQLDVLATAQKALPGASLNISHEQYAAEETQSDSTYYSGSEALITDETDSVPTDQDDMQDEQERQTVPDDSSEEMNSVMENVRSRLSEVVSSRPTE